MKYNFYKYLLGACMVLLAAPQVMAQRDTETFDNLKPGEKKHKRAWEIGIGGTGFHMPRMKVLDFNHNIQQGYGVSVNKRDLIFGGNIYVARELNPYLYLDLQGNVGFAKDPVKGGGKENNLLYMGGLGLQWRLGEYFEGKYIDPFVRVGANYMHKSFTLMYDGTETDQNDQLNWNFDIDHNKSGADRKNLIPISVGTGINMWLSKGFGVGLQADYLIMPYAKVANVWQGTARLVWRVGGKAKRPAPQVSYIEKVVERVVEKPVVVEKIVEKEVRVEENLCDLFNYIFFDFDKSDITKESEETLDKVANILKKNSGHKYLIIGYTDMWGTPTYNIALSQRRAKAVVDALVKRGVPKEMLKSRGVGKKVAYVAKSAPDNTRRGDRKVSIERVTNMDYWNYLP